MEINNNNNQVMERICKDCGISNLIAKFGKNRWVCYKCCSIKNNIKLKEKNYHKIYYEENKQLINDNVKSYYKSFIQPHNIKLTRGRPKRII